MAAAARSFLTIEQFEILSKDKEPNCEYWFGETVAKEMPTVIHGIVQWVLAMILDRMGWRTSTEVRLKLSTMAEFVPDLIADPQPLQGPYPTEAFGLCVEIVSPVDDLAKLIKKSAHYLDWKIETAWIIDPQKRKAWVMSCQSPAPMEVDADGVLTAGSGDTALHLPMVELLAEVDKRS